MKRSPYKLNFKRLTNSYYFKVFKENALQEIKKDIEKYIRGKKIGFSKVSSLKSMGLIPRSNGFYILSQSNY